jgi:hypothetical protein
MRRGVHEELGEVGTFGWVVILLVVGALVAVPYVFMTRQEANDAQTAVAAGGRANDVAAQADLVNATTVAQAWFATNGTLQGFSPTEAAAQEPSIVWDAAAAQPGHVSVRGADATSVVLVTLGAGGPLCVGIIDGAVTRGRADAATAAQCTDQGW